MNPPILLAGAALASAALTAVAIRSRNLGGRLDVPNERSLHERPTPRGGGVAIVVVTTLVVLWLAARGELSPRLAVGLAGGGSAVALIGWLDDKTVLGNASRMTIWSLAAALGAWSAGGLPTLSIGPTTLTLGIAGWALAVVGIVWSINLYNFMDGIDGLAGGTAVIVAGAAAVLTWGAPTAVLLAVVGAASLGFLMFNWPPAKVFMGDVGSGWLGYLFAVLALQGERSGSLPLLAWLLLLGVFVVDATLTVARRIAAGERWYAPHRSHAYQLLARARTRHLPVTVALLCVTLILAVLVALARATGALLPAFLLGYALLGVAWVVATRGASWRRSQRS